MPEPPKWVMAATVPWLVSRGGTKGKRGGRAGGWATAGSVVVALAGELANVGLGKAFIGCSNSFLTKTKNGWSCGRRPGGLVAVRRTG